MDLTKLRAALVTRITNMEAEKGRVRDAAIARVAALDRDISAAQRIVNAIDTDTDGSVNTLLSDIVELGVEFKGA